MKQIIPGLPDINSTEHIGSLPSQTELVVMPASYVEVLSTYIQRHVVQVFLFEEDRFIDAFGEGSQDIFRSFMCVPFVMQLGRDISDFLSRLRELPHFLQRLIITHLPDMTEISDMDRLLDFVHVVSELQRLEKKYPGKLTCADYEFAHAGWGDGFYRNVRHLRARLEGDALF